MPPQAQQRQQSSEIASLTMETFAGCNTATTRQGVPDEQVYWLDGWMPLAARNLRALWGIGSALYTAGATITIVCFYFYNIGSTPYAVVFLSDGSVVQVRTTDGVTTTILPSGTIINVNITQLGVSQWTSQYLLIVANQSNGYWVWDGSVLYSAGSLAPGVTLTNVGSGYFAPPSVSATGGHGSGATFVATISNGAVNSVTMTNAGSGYFAGDSPTLVFTGGNTAGSGASLTAVLSHNAGGSGAVLTPNWRNIGGDAYQLTSITVTNGGTGYDAPPTLQATFGSAPAGTQWQANAAPSISVGESGGVITFASIVANPSNPFNVFDNPGGGFPTITITDSGIYYVSSVTINSGGTDYGPSAVVTASGGGSPLSQATFTVQLSSGVIVGVPITSGGVYQTNTPPTLTVTDTLTNAAGTVTLFPFGVQGTAVVSYQGHVWVFNGTLKQWSAPGSVTNFSTANGGGSETSSSSTQRVGYIGAISTNGFLFEISDSSMDYISGVQTTGSGPATTTFTENNSDPEIGTPYPAAITTLGQEIFIANATGIFVSSGGTFVKISEAMDGVYNTIPASNFNSNPFNGFQLSAAKATLFGKRVWMVLVPIVDPVSNTQVNKLLLVRDKKIWWASQQDVGLFFIQGQEINSTYTAYGTDGKHLYPLFNQPSTAFTKLVQSKLWDDPGGYESDKSDTRFWALLDCASTSSTNLFVDIDSVLIDGSGNQVTNTQPYTLTGPTAVGHFCTPQQAIGQQGILTGMTISTVAADITLVSAKIAAENVGYRG